jgi:hypothetical protein
MGEVEGGTREGAVWIKIRWKDEDKLWLWATGC